MINRELLEILIRLYLFVRVHMLLLIIIKNFQILNCIGRAFFPLCIALFILFFDKTPIGVIQLVGSDMAGTLFPAGNQPEGVGSFVFRGFGVKRIPTLQ